jgi:hypothetical protein
MKFSCLFVVNCMLPSKTFQLSALSTRIIKERFPHNEVLPHLIVRYNLRGRCIKGMTQEVAATVTYVQLELLALDCSCSIQSPLQLFSCQHQGLLISNVVCGVCSHNVLGVIRPITAGDKELTICTDVIPIYIYITDIKIQHGVPYIP